MEQYNQSYTDYIRGLTVDYLTSTIEEGELETLRKEVKDNPEAQLAFKETLVEYNRPEVQEFFRHIEVHNQLPESLQSEIFPEKKKRGRTRYLLLSLAAAALVIAFSFVWYPVLFHISSPKQVASQIILKIADGKSISLSSGDKKIQAGGTTLFNQDSSLSYTTTNTSEEVTGMNTLTVPAGMDYKISLSDGSKVWLNSATTLSFPFKFTDKRVISVSGEAFIEVAPDADRPFTVNLPSGRSIEVLGTSFNINSYEHTNTHISVVTGSVKVKADGHTLNLKQGYEAIADGSALKMASFDASDVLAWREGKYYFNMTPLSEVCKVISRWYGVQVIMDNPASGAKLFTGNLNKSFPLTVFLNRTQSVIGIDYYIKDNTIHIK
ncbi:FecR family protein [Chitinophaga sp. YR573]|uniref:FecR family protein n=1 Tax=Chitinophaga sp. YR573 TaxID=1881040 RepID=UPI0008BC0872|nr:FecR domain-containing protein [Chitinophaga sp. YR573]SEW21331.1 FecR family protein [Chitinophaga sp. YR573]